MSGGLLTWARAVMVTKGCFAVRYGGVEESSATDGTMDSWTDRGQIQSSTFHFLKALTCLSHTFGPAPSHAIPQRRSPVMHMRSHEKAWTNA